MHSGRNMQEKLRAWAHAPTHLHKCACVFLLDCTQQEPPTARRIYIGEILSFEFLQQNIEYLQKAAHEPAPPPDAHVDGAPGSARKKRARKLEPAFAHTPNVFERFNNSKNAMMIDWRDEAGSHTKSVQCTKDDYLDDAAYEAKRMRIAEGLQEWFNENVRGA